MCTSLWALVCVWTLHHHFFFRKVTLTGVLSRILSLWGGNHCLRGLKIYWCFTCTCRSFKVEVKSHLELNFSLDFFFFCWWGEGGVESGSIWEGSRPHHTRLNSVNSTYPAGHSLWIMFSTLSQSVMAPSILPSLPDTMSFGMLLLYQTIIPGRFSPPNFCLQCNFLILESIFLLQLIP